MIYDKLEQPKDSEGGIKELYCTYKMGVSMKHIKIMALLIGIFNLFLMIPDILMIENSVVDILVLIFRGLFSALLLCIYIFTKKIKSFRHISFIVSVCEGFSYLIFIFVLSQYSNPNFLIQTLGIMIIIIVIFLVPNQMINMLFVSVLGSAGFLICSYLTIDGINIMEYWAAFVYISIAIVLSSQAARITEMHQYREFVAKNKLEQLSTTDFLTNTVNRFKMDEEANKWIGFCRDNKLPLSLVFIDIDDFKLINDHYGHLVGDSVLSSLSELIRSQLRTTDIISRWGGDEFVLLFPNTSLDDAVSITERIRNIVIEHSFINDIQITCCFGLVEMKDTNTFDMLIQEADFLMYQGKKLNKNKLQYSKH